MKNRYRLLLLIFIGLLITLTPTNVYADIGSKTIGTSTTDRGVSESFQRKFFYANGRYWIFYSDGVNMIFRTSIDGNTWSSATTVRACDNGEKFSIWFDGTYFHYAYCPESAGTPIYYRRGTPNGGGISWSSSEKVAVAGATGTTYYVPYIAVDSGGYPWIGYRLVKGTSPKRPYVTKSSKNDGSWLTQSGFPYDLSGWDAAAWVVAPIPLSSGKMFVIYTSFGHYIRGKRWTGTWGSEVRTVNGISSDYFSAVAEGDDVHLAFLSSTTILYTKYTYSTNSWGSEVKVKSSATSTSAPILSYDAASGYVFCFWMASNHIYYRKSSSGIWISPPTDWITESETIKGNDLLTGFYSASNGYIGLVYLTKTSKPYNVRFVSLSTPKIEKTFISIVENPGGAPSGTKYFASLSNGTYQKDIELTDPEGYGTYTGSIGSLSAGVYDWKVYYSFGSVKETIASGHETIDRVRVNIIRWSWTGVISGQKWVDCNNNGVRDQGEYTIGGWPIRLYKKIDGNWVLYWEEFTGRWQLFKWGDGIYKFFNLGPGEYKVEQVEREGWVRTYPADGYIVNLGTGEKKDKLNFGDHWTGLPDTFLMIDDKTGGIYYGTQGGLWWATYGYYAYIIPNPDQTKVEYPIGPDYPAGDHYLNDEVGGPGIGHVRYRVYTLRGDPLGSFGYEAYEWAYDDYHSSREVVDGKAFPGAQYFHSVNKWRATKWHSGDPNYDPLAVEVELGETGFYRVAYYVLEEGARAMSYELYRDGNIIGSRFSYPTGYFKGGKYIVFLVTLRHAPQNLTMLAWTDKANAIIAGVFIDKLCEVPPAFEKKFELTVTNPDKAPEGVTYLATLYQETTFPCYTITVQLTDPDQDGTYTGTISDLDPGEYRCRFYYIIDDPQGTTIKEETEYIGQSMTNIAEWSWNVTKSFELTVTNPDKAPNYPNGKYYGAVSIDGSTWPAEWKVELEDPVAAETFTGKIENLAPGHYFWKIYYVGSPEIVIAEGEEDIFDDVTNVASLLWPTYSKEFELTVTNPSEAPDGVRYWGALSSDGTTWPEEWTIELTGSNGIYSGTISDLVPGPYYYRFFYSLDSVNTTIKEGYETLDQSKANTATWSWRITKTFELTIEKASRAPQGVIYYGYLSNIAYGGDLEQEVELELEASKYIGSIEDVPYGKYDWKIVARWDTIEQILASGTESLTKDKINEATYTWPPGTTLSAKKTAEGHWVRTWNWTIDKDVTQREVELYVNDEGTIYYNITVTKVRYTDRIYVSGEISVNNGGEVATEGLWIVDAVQYKIGSGKFQNLTESVIVPKGGDFIGPGETKTYPYEIEFEPITGATYRNRVYVKITNHAGHSGEYWGPEPADDFSIPDEPEIVNDKVSVSDNETIPSGLVLMSSTEPEWPQTIDATTTFEFQKNIRCNSIGSYVVRDTATVTVDDDQIICSESAEVTINVLQPSQQEFTTYTQGGWGSKPEGNNPGAILEEHFDVLYTEGIEIGISGESGYSMKFTSAKAIEEYLPAGGKPSTLDADYVDPTETSSGIFGGQVLALKLNVDFSDAGITNPDLGSLKLCNTGTSLDGKTIKDILDAANIALGGGSLPDGYSISQLNDLVTNLNEAFADGTPSAWAQAHLC